MTHLEAPSSGSTVGLRQIMPWLFFGVYALVLSAISIVRYQNGYARFFDMGIYVNDMWLLSHGYGHSSLIARHVLSDHAASILVFLAPLYRVLPQAELLLVVQALAMAASLFPAIRLARYFAVPVRFAYLLVIGSAPFFSAAIFDFHPSVLAVPAMFWAIVGLLEQRRKWLIVSLIIVLICRADLVIFVLALWIVAGRRYWRIFLTVSAIGVFATVLPSLLVPVANFGDFYGDLGSSPIDIALHPWRVVPRVLSAAVGFTVLTWLLPVGFLNVLRLRWFIAFVVTASPLLLLDSSGLGLAFFHYGAQLFPLTVAGAFAGINSIASDRSRVRATTALVLGTTTALLLSVAVPVVQSEGAVPFTEKKFDVRPFEAGVDAGAIAVEENLVPYFANRKTIYVFPQPFEPLKQVPTPSPPTGREKSTVTQVIVFGKNRQRAERFGFTRVVLQDRDVFVLERP